MHTEYTYAKDIIHFLESGKGWINIKQRKPEFNKIILFKRKHSIGTSIGYYDGSKFHDYSSMAYCVGEYTIDDVKSWQDINLYIKPQIE